MFIHNIGSFLLSRSKKILVFNKQLYQLHRKRCFVDTRNNYQPVLALMYSNDSTVNIDKANQIGIAYTKMATCRCTHSRNTIDVNVIRTHTEKTRNHMTPELALNLITPSTDLWKQPLTEGERDTVLGGDPYWAFYWPGGQVLTRFILDNPHLVKDKRVVDIGSGCGASAIAASLCGGHVIANDVDINAVEAIKVNASDNNVVVMTNSTDLIQTTNLPHCDVLLLGDMFYDEDMVDILYHWLNTVHQQGRVREVYIGDPGRLMFIEHPIYQHLQSVYRCSLPEDVQVLSNGLTKGAVWRYMYVAGDVHR